MQSGAYHATLGLIANNFVRVAHRVSSDCASNLAPVLSNVKIEAAILSLQHSFIVDNYACGTALAKLTVADARSPRPAAIELPRCRSAALRRGATGRHQAFLPSA